MKHEDTSALPQGWAEGLGALRYGLYFLSTGALSEPRGMLVSWVTQVSGRPPMVAVAIRHNRSVLPWVERNGAFAINLLPAGDIELVRALGRVAGQRFEGIELETSSRGTVVIARGLGWICSEVVEVWRPGDHAVVVGKVVEVKWKGGDEVLTAQAIGHSYLGLS